tara:strand:+ start:60 stop:569 length:510 start_codon:yes stop_codon:yes gene_type:complete
MIELYLLILIIIFLLSYLYNNNKELFTIPENILILNSDSNDIKLKWKKPTSLTTDFIETDWDYYLEETNQNDDMTLYKKIDREENVTDLNYIIFNLTDQKYFKTTYPITNWMFVLHRINKTKTISVSSNSVIFTPKETDGEIQYSEANCKTINNNFLENLKGKKINIYI